MLTFLSFDVNYNTSQEQPEAKRADYDGARRASAPSKSASESKTGT